ncbi:sialate O-acetylesterase [Haloferula sp. A504]|uniref:sialate O-acetylesterase n=1 Tax=Haloferula sp. A504 TaxID=3373601 RepID=UPI0031CC14B5|nr:sialate O-acetylesterase [Verrucomicrobiaceae bacterium E54]
MKTSLASLLLTLSLGVGISAAESRLELAVPFTDHMILQREAKVPVWGFDAPGSKVTVEFAGQTKTAEADAQGDWKLELDPLQASKEGRGFKVANNKGQSIELSDVLVGEVWFSSGQSNMVWTAGKSMVNELVRELAGSETDIPIREISIETVSALYPQKRATSAEGWKTIQGAGSFSALSLAFAHSLYQELDVPVGILLSAHSNTRIEAFTQRQAIEEHPDLEGDEDLIHDADPLLEQGRQAFAKYYEDLAAWQEEAGRISEAGGKVPQRPNLPGIAGMWRGPSQFFNGKINPVIPYAIRGAIWCQGTSNSGDGRIYAARMEALVHGWRDAWGMPDMPFYFTQMQAYGAPDPNNVGFADIRQAQHLFFINNRENVGMVVQTDLNSARPQGIHYWEKLHPGMRMARWALAKDYGKDIPFTGPIYQGYEVEGDQVVVSFEKGSLFGGLMVGSKGMAADYREEGKYVEPARPTPGEKLNHFRVCGADKKWHAAEATIVGDTVVVKSKNVPEPVGVQYAYNAVPVNSNLYNKAGLPATPFAAIDGKLIFEEDDPAKAAAEEAKYARYTDPDYPIFQVLEFYRDGAVIQRDQTIPVWGHANEGVEVTVTLGGVTRKAVANELQQWSVEFPPLKASAGPITLEAVSSHDRSRTVNNILVGDVWYLTGSPLLTSDWPFNLRDKEAKRPEPLPLVREFRKKTKASTSTTPRKRSFETGGGKYRSSWEAADYSKEGAGVGSFAYHFAKALDRKGVPQGFITMSAGRTGRSRELASPLSWTSFQGVKDVKQPAFEARLDELFLQFPNSGVAKKAAARHVDEVKAFVSTIIDLGEKGADLSKAPLRGPAFPEAGTSGAVARDTIPTYAYNWCVSPMTPMGVAGVIWIPSDANIGENPAEYAAEMEIYAKSLPGTYGMDQVPFLYAQPSPALVEGITEPKIPGAKPVPINEWPKSLKELAEKMAGLVE